MRYFVSDTIKFTDLRQVLKLLVKIKSSESGHKLSEAYLNLILDFHFYGINKDTYELHISKSESDKSGYFKSIATIDNSKSYLKRIGIIDEKTYLISSDYLPTIGIDDECYLNLKLYNDNQNK